MANLPKFRIFILQVGDGTTTVTLLAAALLKHAKQFVEDGVHPQVKLPLMFLCITHSLEILYL